MLRGNCSERPFVSSLSRRTISVVFRISASLSSAPIAEAIARNRAFNSRYRASPLEVRRTSFDRRCLGLSMNATSPSAASSSASRCMRWRLVGRIWAICGTVRGPINARLRMNPNAPPPQLVMSPVL
jgi:hypothetical protein